MVTKTEKLENSRVKLTVAATAAQFSTAFNQELQEVGKDIQIQGFRKGKAPQNKVLEQVGRQRVEAGALDKVISDTYYQAVQEAKLVPIEGPVINVVKYQAPSEAAKDDEVVVEFTAEADVIPEVSVDGYQKIKIKKPEAPKVSDEELERVVAYVRNQRATLKEAAADAKAEKGMWADLSYTGTVDGVSRSDMKNEHHPIVIGEGQLIPGFEDAVIGLTAGEEKTFPITFPKDYGAKELAGKEAEFTIKINELKNVILPELDEEFAKSLGHDTWAQVEEAIRKDVIAEKEEANQREREEEVLNELLKIAKFEVPVALVNQEHERIFTEAKNRVIEMNMPWDAYLSQAGKTEEQVKEEMREQAERNVKIGLALGKVIQDEKIENSQNAGKIAVEHLVALATK